MTDTRFTTISPDVQPYTVQTWDKETQTDRSLPDGREIQFREIRGNHILQIGSNTVVDIIVTKDFLQMAKEDGEYLVCDKNTPVVMLKWSVAKENESEAVKAVKSLWTLQLKELFESMYEQVLSHLSHSLFSPLRELIVDTFKKYDAKLTGIFCGSLLFVFWHADEESAQSMVAGKEVVREMFHQLLLGMGKGEIEFTLDAAVDTSDSMEAAASGKVGGGEEVDADPLASLTVGTDPLTDANIQLKTIEETSKKAADLKELESRLQSMESSFRRMQREMNEHMDSTRGDMGRGLKEMRDVTQTLIETVLKKTSETPQNKEPTRSERTLPTDPLDVSTLMEKIQGFPIAPMTLGQFQQTAYAAYMVNAVTADSSLRTKSTDQPTSMTERNEPTEVASNVMVEEAADEQQMSGPGSADIPVSLEGTAIEKDTGILPSRSAKDIPCEPNDGAVPAKQKYGEAEQLLSSLNVADVGGRASDPGVRRWTAAVAAALVHDVPPPPRAMSLDTLLCIDVSDSIGMPGLEEVKQIAKNFVDGIEDIAEQHGLEENVGVVSLGGGAKVVQQLTNDYGAVRDAIENLVCCGRSPIFEALLVCVAAMKEGGGVLTVGGAHKIRPRIIFITDGLATDESYPVGQDTASTDLNTKIQLIQLMGELSPKKNSSTPHPITWVPVAAADRSFLSSLSKLGDGNIVEGKDITTLCTYYRVQESIGNIYMCVESREWENLSEAVEVMAGAFIGDMRPEDKRSIIQEVKAKIERKDSSAVDDDPDDFDNLKELKDLPPLGSRVSRGPAWKYQDQDAGGPGTVINHADDEKHVWVEWDLNSVACRYRFGSKGMYDIIEEDTQPRILKPDELIEIGCRVRRGDDWSSGDKDGGPGNIGVIIRKRQDGKVKVRWHNGVIQACNYGYDGKFELAICSLEDIIPSGQRETTLSADVASKKGHAMPTPEKPHVLWQWHDDRGQWRLYDGGDTDKLNREFARKPTGSCILQKQGRSFRVLFNLMKEKCVEYSTMHEVRRLVVSDEDRDEFIAKEISISDESSWTSC